MDYCHGTYSHKTFWCRLPGIEVYIEVLIRDLSLVICQSNMADVSKKVRIRAGHRSHARKIITIAKETIERIEGGNTGLLKKLKSLESELKDKLSQLKSMDTDIAENLEDEKAIDQEVEASCDFVSAVYDCISEVQSTIASYEASAVNMGNSGNDIPPSNPLTAMYTKPNIIHARLPKLELKKFGGNPVE